MKRIFIGGLGRSGTTILLHALYCHPDIYAVPIETKFLVEEDGFADLITALTSRFSVAGAPVAFRRFQQLMCEQVPGLVDGKFRQLEHLPSEVFINYQRALEEFLSRFPGAGVYFSDRRLLLDATRCFVGALFDAEAVRSGKSVWVEKTPSNYWRLPFLRELWPDCYFIHAVRDPRAIFLSLMERSWLPEDVGCSLSIFESHLAALLELRRAYLEEARFIEVRLEDLVEAPQRTLDALAKALGVQMFEASATAAVVESMGAYYARKPLPGVTLSNPERAMMDQLLLPAVSELRYPMRWEPR